MSLTIKNADPIETWDALKSDTSAVLVDVRTTAEWAFVGTPDLSSLGREPILLEWKQFPHMQQNDGFAHDLLGHLGDNTPTQIFFLCRSGVRSLAAADLMAGVFAAQSKQVDCINIAEGFEGDLDSHGHRGAVNGWKVKGCAWRQS